MGAQCSCILPPRYGAEEQMIEQITAFLGKNRQLCLGSSLSYFREVKQQACPIKFLPALGANQLAYRRTSSKMSAKCPIKQEVVDFNKGKLKRTETAEKNPLPTTKVIDDEKIAIEEKCAKVPLNKELEGFKKDHLKKAEMKEKNPLPTTDEPLNEEVGSFNKQQLKKTTTKEKNSRPTAAELKRRRKP
ncbi:hypothetical protein F7725_009938 [Dissostichus mawsoni]|uniref:Uncharacterized protein n=1 Tax=Dissostichus mawsoni TaxID=36200 RepID=A0A7J5XME8_DISMA|nr:hypothetical protein F7725_009938 [Dissostichus mawsoni]